ncbi:hypothetical protein FACS189431_6430 [Alphaproteobacteria bacterium]|nr:hypothetical protein FACS189431_6430 [Alphaproteobacteria bacterium]
MGQQEYNNFKQHLKDWKEIHPEEYDCFEAEMNSRDAVGYQKIMNFAVSLVPAYQKFVNQKANQGTFDDISEIENLFTENQLTQTLLNEFENPDKNTIIPAMLYWLYFGQSFERMVEKGEELRKTQNISYFQKFLIKSTIRLLRSKSISLGLRTKSDWEHHFRLIKEVDSNEALDLEIDVKANTPLAKSKNNKELSLEEMIMIDDKKKEILLTKIGDYIRQGTKGKKIAWMIFALRQLGYLPNTTSDRHLFNAIREKFGMDIGSDKGIYAYLDNNTLKYDKIEIEALMNYFKLN